MSVTVPAFAARVVKSYRYDYNTALGYNTNYHNYQYMNISDSARYRGNQIYRVGGAWNYIRYERLNFYS
ncbi:MAG: hypothetical protein H9W80_05165 [Enterococcus sp.]|nr:hypothetical protein [Enterococcus sp.]